MKALTALFIAFGLTTAAHAQYVVTNPISDVLDEIMHVEDIAKTVVWSLAYVKPGIPPSQVAIECSRILCSY